jgi:hypothetical protein
MSPGRRLGREAASEILSPKLSPVAAACALAQAAAMARTALAALGDDVPGPFRGSRWPAGPAKALATGHTHGQTALVPSGHKRQYCHDGIAQNV